MKNRIPVVAVFDIGKTNKKLLLFDQFYNLVKENISQFEEIYDEDGFPCENLEALSAWLLREFQMLKGSQEYELKAVNFSTYGASLVHVDRNGKPVGYLYNYLKPYPENLMGRFLDSIDRDRFSLTTCSPLMGHLNAGMQLYWLKYERPELFSKIAATLHFPQYLSFLITGRKFAETTNVGCHSAMWNFEKQGYHSWLEKEGISNRLCDIAPGDSAVPVKNEFTGESITVGIGLHDSSAALIPYLKSFPGPFMILSTGTWAISLNPFNKTLPQTTELAKGCLSYLSYEGNPVKASMLFSGNDHDLQVRRIAEHFNIGPDFYKTVNPDDALLNRFLQIGNRDMGDLLVDAVTPSYFHKRSLSDFSTHVEAYHQLVVDLVTQQRLSSGMVLKGADVSDIYVDGGFCKNELYMKLIADAFPEKTVYAASMNQGTALGSALAIHKHWNTNELANSFMELTKWPSSSLNTVEKI